MTGIINNEPAESNWTGQLFGTNLAIEVFSKEKEKHLQFEVFTHTPRTMADYTLRYWFQAQKWNAETESHDLVTRGGYESKLGAFVDAKAMINSGWEEVTLFEAVGKKDKGAIVGYMSNQNEAYGWE